MKSEPETFSVDDLASAPKQTEHWDGVRNYQARNFMRAMKRGDQAFFYHSNCAEPGIVGIVRVVREAYPDFTAVDPNTQRSSRVARYASCPAGQPALNHAGDGSTMGDYSENGKTAIAALTSQGSPVQT